MKEFTKEKWQQDGLLIRAYGRGIIATIPTPNNGGVFECVANAQLIAASPLMFEKLVKIKTWLTMLVKDAQEHLKTERNFITLVEAWQHDIKNYQAVIADIDKVLAQAEGRTP